MPLITAYDVELIGEPRDDTPLRVRTLERTCKWPRPFEPVDIGSM